MDETREFGGYLADHYYCDNAVQIECGKSISGSGPKAFNGARSWPTLRVKIPFEIGEEAKMEAMADQFEGILKDAGIICEEDDAARRAWVEGHWAYATCYGCGKILWFGGLCDECKKKAGRCCKCGKVLQANVAVTNCPDCNSYIP